MKILSIESSCDETAISIVDFSGRNFSILSDITLTQIDIHKKYGGVYPALAKREHIKNIYPLLLESLKKAKLLKKRKSIKKIDDKMIKDLEKIMEHDSHNFRNMIDLYQNYEKPNLKCIPVTYGPGLEMSLWTGFNIARCIEYIWNIPMVPVNHMEGHIYSSLIVEKSKNKFTIPKLSYPSMSLLISGGHTELVLIKDELKYKIVGQTLDDAVGEAYDKSARLLGVPYPGGPVVSKYAENFREKNGSDVEADLLPRPMLHTKDLNFSFSGLKTAVLTIANKQKRKTQKFKDTLCYEFEEAVSDVLIKKTVKAIEKYKIKELVLGGGVSANDNLRREFKKLEDKSHLNGLKVYLPAKKYTGDNALMIAIAGYFRFKNDKYPKNTKKVVGNLKLK